MQAIRYHVSIPRFLLQRALGCRFPALYYGPLSCLRLDRVDPPALPGPDWLIVRPILAGICGTDLATITAKSSPSLSPFNSFPAVLGHEVVARVEEAGPAVTDIEPGQRIVVEPYLPCRIRGLPDCPACALGNFSQCHNVAEGTFAPGMILGFCQDLPGGWGEQMAVHRSQAYPVPPQLSDEQAVLVEPLCIGLHAVLRRLPQPKARVLIIGGGAIGLCTLAALRLLEIPCHVTVVAKHRFQQEMARRLGADHVFGTGREAGALAAAERVTGARRYRPLIGRPVLSGGFDGTFDCVGSRGSVDESLRVTAPGGTVVLVGGAGEIGGIDWTFVWARELAVIGTLCYGMEECEGRRLHTFDLALELLAARPDYPIADLVTHRFPVARYRDALRALLGRAGHGVIKAVLEPAARQAGQAPR